MFKEPKKKKSVIHCDLRDRMAFSCESVRALAQAAGGDATLGAQ